MRLSVKDAVLGAYLYAWLATLPAVLICQTHIGSPYVVMSCVLILLLLQQIIPKHINHTWSLNTFIIYHMWFLSTLTISDPCQGRCLQAAYGSVTLPLYSLGLYFNHSSVCVRPTSIEWHAWICPISSLFHSGWWTSYGTEPWTQLRP
jgi:hypothetical protein